MYRKTFFALALIVPLLVSVAALRWPGVLWLFAIVGPLIALGLHDVVQRKHSLMRIYPVIGHGRYLMEEFRAEILSGRSVRATSAAARPTDNSTPLGSRKTLGTTPSK